MIGCMMGSKIMEYITDEEAQAAGERYREWKKTQPEFIAQPFTLEDYMYEIDYMQFNNFVDIPHQQLEGDKYKLIMGRLCKKVKNPYNEFQDIIPWPEK